MNEILYTEHLVHQPANLS